MKKYWTDLGERVVSSFAEGALGVTGMTAMSILDLDWKAVLGVGAFTAFVTLLKTFAAKGVGNGDSASLSSKI
jgi:hypothetical protein